MGTLQLYGSGTVQRAHPIGMLLASVARAIVVPTTTTASDAGWRSRPAVAGNGATCPVRPPW